MDNFYLLPVVLGSLTTMAVAGSLLSGDARECQTSVDTTLARLPRIAPICTRPLPPSRCATRSGLLLLASEIGFACVELTQSFARLLAFGPKRAQNQCICCGSGDMTARTARSRTTARSRRARCAASRWSRLGERLRRAAGSKLSLGACIH